ncbi:MAG: M81 family metallopeptidase [Pseudomonadota bacterium]
MARIAVGGWQHETNTFAATRADFQAFERADEWPSLSVGTDLFTNTDGVHLPITGAIDALNTRGHDLVPLLWCSATPCSYVTEEAFERISDHFMALLDHAGPLDGLYLDLHGAMVCEHFEDGEGEFLRRVRERVGYQIPIAVSLDLHANVTPEMVAHADVIDIFRTYPHIDMGETGARVAGVLHEMVVDGLRLKPAFRQTEFLIALNSGCSLIEPCQSLYANMPKQLNSDVRSISLACGFHLSDIHHVGPALVAYATEQRKADAAADALFQQIHSQRNEFGQTIWLPEDGVAKAERLLQADGGTIVLADTQDNPGGGGSGDTTGLLQSLIQARCGNSAFGVLSDAETVTAAAHAGVGSRFTTALGGKSGLPGQIPYDCEATVLQLSDGQLTATGPMYKGARMTLGPCALIEVGGIKVAVSTYPVQTADKAIFRHFGIEPGDMDILALKSSVHFRNDYTDIASHILVIAAPGAVLADPATLAYRNKRSEIALR